MGTLRRFPLEHVVPGAASAAPQPGVRVLTNSCVGLGHKVLAQDGWLVAVLPLHAPTAAYAFDTIIVSPSDLGNG